MIKMRKTSKMHRSIKMAILITGVFTLVSLQVEAARYVTVATIGDWVSPVDKSKGMQDVVEQIEDFWHKKLEQVYPDNPDLIVLPEYCDFPEGNDQG